MSANSPPLALVVMGVSGCGKSTVAAMLAGRLHWAYIEGDDLHPPANVEKMHAGTPLTDADRAPWLDAIANEVFGLLAVGQSCVVTCSALKRRYRDAITRGDARVRFVYLHGDRELIARRLAHRLNHFMPASLLDSQFATLEEPTADEHAIRVETGLPPAEIVNQVVAAAGL